jgi:hypothetical protein
MPLVLHRLVGASHVTRGVVGFLADAVTLIALVGAGIGLATRGSVSQAILATYVCLLATALLAVVLTGELTYGRRVRQSHAFPTFANAIGVLSRATHAVHAGGSAETFAVSLREAVGLLADAYGTAAGVPCRVTVKAIVRPSRRAGRDDLTVRTVCRSSGPARATSDTGVDWINDNTDFRHILRDGADHFFCNDLVAAISDGYRNSHFTEDVVARRRFPYRATIVWPVRGAVDDPDQWDLIGFVCVDSAQAGAFDPGVDVAPGAAFADALYSGLDTYLTAQGSSTGARRAT